MGTLSGKRVVVIGGSAGMGYAIAEAAVEADAEVVIASRTADRLSRAAGQLDALGKQSVTTCMLHVEDRSTVAEMLADHAPIDHLVLPGSTVEPARYDELTDQIARDSFDSKFWGPFWTVFDARPHMSSGGSIVFFSGVASQRPVPGYVIGACINGALEAATRSLALELGPLGLRINTLSPGFIMTPLFNALHDPEDLEQRIADAVRRLPLRRYGEPEEAASVALMFMTNGFITGQVVVLDGGLLATN